MPSYDTDRKWSDKYIPAIKQIVGPHLLEESSIQVDQEKATDLIVMSTANQHIACRVRRAKFWPRYAGQFTIRFKRRNGAKTELAKFIDGFCDLMFYGFAEADDKASFAEWYLINLRHWRSHLIRHHKTKAIVKGVTPNTDGQTSFMWFDVGSFPAEPPLLEASYVPQAIGEPVFSPP